MTCGNSEDDAQNRDEHDSGSGEGLGRKQPEQMPHAHTDAHRCDTVLNEIAQRLHGVGYTADACVCTHVANEHLGGFCIGHNRTCACTEFRIAKPLYTRNEVRMLLAQAFDRGASLNFDPERNPYSNTVQHDVYKEDYCPAHGGTGPVDDCSANMTMEHLCPGFEEKW